MHTTPIQLQKNYELYKHPALSFGAFIELRMNVKFNITIACPERKKLLI